MTAAQIAGVLYFMLGGLAASADGPRLVQPWKSSETPEVLRSQLEQGGFDSRLVTALGSVGNQSDITLIRSLESAKISTFRKAYSEASSIATASKPVANTALWATARLGDRDSLNAVAERLAPPDPQEPSFANVRRWKAFQEEMTMAVYIGNRRLLPAIYRSLVSQAKTPFFECFYFRPPADTAVRTLKQLVPKEDYPNKVDVPADWIRWFHDKKIVPD